MSDKMRATLLTRGISAAAAACVFALVQGCAIAADTDTDLA